MKYFTPNLSSSGFEWCVAFYELPGRFEGCTLTHVLFQVIHMLVGIPTPPYAIILGVPILILGVDFPSFNTTLNTQHVP